MNKDYKVGIKGLAIVKAIHEEHPGKDAAVKKNKRTYFEGVYYGYLSLAAVTAIGIITMVGCLAYYSMSDESYYTTDYKGDVRVLNPLLIEER